MRLQSVRSAKQLLAPHAGLVTTIEAVVDADPRYWSALYLPVINAAADYYQALSLERTQTLLESALCRTIESLRHLREFDGDQVRPIRKFSCFSSALLLEAALPPLLEVEVDKETDKVIWNPATHPRIANLGQFYIQRRASVAIGADSSLCPILALPLLPASAKDWLLRDLEEFQIWTATLAGRGDTPLAQIIKQQQAVEVYRSPRERIRPFIDHLRRQIAERRINRPESALHVVMEGLFLALPVAFTDYDACGWQSTRTDLLAADVVIPPTVGSLWVYRESISDRKAKTLQGLVLDCSRIDLDIRTGVNPRLLPVTAI